MGSRQRILLIDDDPDFVEATKAILQNDYDVSVAADGHEGLQKARDVQPDLILLDVIMPATDGFTVAERLKEDSELSRIPVLMLTSFGERMKETSIPRSRGFSLEAEDYLEKPVAPKELLDRIKGWLARAAE